MEVVNERDRNRGKDRCKPRDNICEGKEEIMKGGKASEREKKRKI